MMLKSTSPLNVEYHPTMRFRADLRATPVSQKSTSPCESSFSPNKKGLSKEGEVFSDSSNAMTRIPALKWKNVLRS
jgi:hypothetical protein